MAGKNLSFAALTWLPRSPWLTWILLPFWFVRNGFTLVREILEADAVFAIIPSPIGILGLVLSLVFRKPLLTRQLNRWSESRFLWRVERALLERIAGGRNVVFATGSGAQAPSSRSHAIRWLFITTISESELASVPRSRGHRIRLLLLRRKLGFQETLTILRALSLLARQFPDVTLDVVGNLATLSQIQQLAPSGALDRATFHGSPSRERVMELFGEAHVLCCLPDAETESYRQVLHEALACGLPVVTTRTEIAPMLKDCALLINEETAESLAAAVTACLSDQERYRSMSAHAVRAARQYSRERWREQVQSALEKAWGPLQSEPGSLRCRTGRETSPGLVK
jgi:hypothetical protein